MEYDSEKEGRILFTRNMVIASFVAMTVITFAGVLIAKSFKR